MFSSEIKLIMKPLIIKTIVIVHVPIKKAFNEALTMELSDVVKQYQNLPAVIKTSITSGWLRPGMQRIIYFEGNLKLKETLVTLIDQTSFSSIYEHFPIPNQFFIKAIELTWSFIELESSKVSIEASSKIVVDSAMKFLILKLIMLKKFNHYQDMIMTELKTKLESGNL